ncbi:hypothetical protein RYX36_012220 [Vicia faba]
MRVNKGKKGPQPGAKKKKSNREQKADAETHVKLNSDEKMSRDDVNISSQLKQPILPSSGEPLLDVPEIIKWMFFNGCSSKQGIEQSSTLKQAKNQKTTMTTVDTAILKHGQRKQQSLIPGSPTQVGGSAQIQHSTLKQAKNQKTTMTTTDTAERSILQHGKRKQQPFTAGSSIQVAGPAQIQHKKQDYRPEIKKSRDVYVSPQLKLPMLPSSGEPLVDVPDSIKSNAELYRGKLRSSKTLKRSMQCFPKQGMEQSSTLEQAKNQKTMRTTVDTAGRSILKPDQRKQQSLTTECSIPVAGSAQIQHSTLKQAKTQKTMKTTIGTAGRSIPNHGQRKQQSFTAGSSIQVEGSAQSRPEDHSLFGGLSNRSSAQFQKDHIDHGPFKKQKTARMCPSMSLDDYFEVYKPRLEVEGDINYENNDSDVEGDINYGNDDGEKTNNNPMEETKHSEEMSAIERKLEVLLRVVLINQSNSGHDMGDMVALLSTPNENNNALHSSASAHALNNHAVNHIAMGEEQSNDDLEEEDDEQLYDDLEDDEQLYDDLEEEDDEQLYIDSEDEDYTG